jgi:hypothetical protein
VALIGTTVDGDDACDEDSLRDPQIRFPQGAAGPPGVGGYSA